MSVTHTPLPQRPATERLAKTDVIRPGRRAAAEPPPAVVVCSWCGAVEDLLHPPGWVVVLPARGGTHYLSGVCPPCLSDRFTFPESCDAD